MNVTKRQKKSGYCLNRFFIILVICTCCCCFPAQAAKVDKNTVLFEDVHSHWAESSITRLSALELVKGYPDHTFKPDQLVSRLETVVLIIRSGGFTTEAEQKVAKNIKKTDTQSKSSVETKQKPKVPWGQSYVDLAVDKGFLALDAPEGYDYDGPVTRLEVAALLARAMYLVPPSQGTGTVSADNNLSEGTGSAPLKVFSDQDRLTPAAQAIITAVINDGIMSGYPDGTFRPQESLTRAEIAVILSRLVDRGWVKIPDGRRLAGWIESIDKKKDHRELDFATLTGKQKLQVANNVLCYQAGEEKSLEQAANFRCEAILNGNGQVCWIDLLEQKDDGTETEKITGTVKMVALGENNLIVICDMFDKDLILPLAWDAVLNGNNTTKGFNSLKQGDFVDVVLAKGQVKEVTLLNVKTLTGKVDRIDKGRLYLTGELTKNKPGWFNHYDRARIVDKDGFLQDEILVGKQVKITYMDPLPKEIDDEIILEIKVMK